MSIVPGTDDCRCEALRDRGVWPGEIAVVDRDRVHAFRRLPAA